VPGAGSVGVDPGAGGVRELVEDLAAWQDHEPADDDDHDQREAVDVQRPAGAPHPAQLGPPGRAGLEPHAGDQPPHQHRDRQQHEQPAGRRPPAHRVGDQARRGVQLELPDVAGQRGAGPPGVPGDGRQHDDEAVDDQPGHEQRGQHQRRAAAVGEVVGEPHPQALPEAGTGLGGRPVAADQPRQPEPAPGERHEADDGDDVQHRVQHQPPADAGPAEDAALVQPAERLAAAGREPVGAPRADQRQQRHRAVLGVPQARRQPVDLGDRDQARAQHGQQPQHPRGEAGRLGRAVPAATGPDAAGGVRPGRRDPAGAPLRLVDRHR
jgi:hypothetical protein